VIERFYFVKLADDAVAERAAIAAHVRGVLGSEATVGVPADESASRWDLSIVIRAPDLGAWHAFAARPDVHALLETWLPERSAVIKSWTFDVTPIATTSA
jgi:hypothetical protein